RSRLLRSARPEVDAIGKLPRKSCRATTRRLPKTCVTFRQRPKTSANAIRPAVRRLLTVENYDLSRISVGHYMRTARFLDHASSLALMRCVGNGYMFMHRSLLDHLAARARSGLRI